MSEALERLREKQGEKDAADASVEPKTIDLQGILARMNGTRTHGLLHGKKRSASTHAVVTSHFA
jgi:hypothetical protein